MINPSLLRTLAAKILPHFFEGVFGVSGDDVSPFSGIPQELLDHIIDFLHDDRQTLLALSLQTDHDRKLNTFFTLLDVSWTTFTHIIKSLCVKDQFNRWSAVKRGPFTTQDVSCITTNLSNVKTLRLTSVSWPYIPQYIVNIFFQLRITDLESVEFRMDDTTDFVNFFVKLQPSVRSISLYDLQFDDDQLQDLSANPTIFRRPINIERLDTNSLQLFKDVWDPLLCSELDITVDSFYLRLANMSREGRETYIPLFSRFLKHVGPSIYHLFIKLTEGYCGYDGIPYYGSVDLTRCVNVRIIHIGTIVLDGFTGSGEKITPTLSAIWMILSHLASDSSMPEDIVFIFRPIVVVTENVKVELENFMWINFIGRVQSMFPKLKAVTIGVGYYAVDNEDPNILLNALRRAPEIKKLEEKGLVLLRMIPWNMFGAPDPPFESPSLKMI